MTASKNATATVRFSIDFLNKTITGTKASFSKASKGYGPEYEELASKVAAHPNFTLVVKQQKTKSTKVKTTYDGLDFPFVETYIETLDNAEQKMAEYEAVKKMAVDCGRKTYPMTKKWFLNEFGTKEKPFNMYEAREAIYAHHIALATKNAASILSVVSSNAPEHQEQEENAVA